MKQAPRGLQRADPAAGRLLRALGGVGRRPARPPYRTHQRHRQRRRDHRARARRARLNRKETAPWTSQARSSSSPAARRASAKARRGCSPRMAARSSSPTCRPSAARRSRPRSAAAFVRCDVAPGGRRPGRRRRGARARQAGRPGQLRRHRAGIKTVGKDGAHPLALVQPRRSRVNLIGSFNMIRLAAEAMAATSPSRPASAAC